MFILLQCVPSVLVLILSAVCVVLALPAQWMIHLSNVWYKGRVQNWDEIPLLAHPS